MKNIKSLTSAMLCLLVTSAFAAIPAFSLQPPINPSTYYVGTIGQPARLDPGRAYDTASGELIQNVYQPLIWFGDKHVIDTAGGVLNAGNNYNYNMTPADHASLDASVPGAYVPVIGTALPTITNSNISPARGIWGQYWTFTLNTSAEFQPWIDHTGATVPRAPVTTDDIVYSFQVQMVEDSPYAPVWMWETAAFNITTFDQLYTADSGPFGQGFDIATGDEAAVASMIQQWCFLGDPSGNNQGTMVTFNFSYPLPQSAMYQIFSQTWGSILDRAFMIEHGCWNYSWYNGWSEDYRRQDGSGNRTPIDRYYNIKYSDGSKASLYTLATPRVGTDIPDMCGTGPYKYTFGAWDQVNKVWRLDADPGYWRGWVYAGQKNGNYIHTIIEKGIDTWPTRKMLFLEGEFDVAVVPRANMYDLLQGSDKYKPLAGLTLVTNITELVNYAVFFTMNVSGNSPYQSYVGYYPCEDGSIQHNTTAMPYFFNDINIRTAFAYAFNYTQYIEQAWYGEAIQQASWWVDGLGPQEAENISVPTRDLNLTEMSEALAQAALVNGSGVPYGSGTLYNISEVGFETTMCYTKGNVEEMIALLMIASAWASLGPAYKCNVVELDQPTKLDNMYQMRMPVYAEQWQAHFIDTIDVARAYMYSEGYFPFNQGPPFPSDQATIDGEIRSVMFEQDATVSDAIYQDLQFRYWQDVISFPLVQPCGRRFARDWVQGWYYNDLLPGAYAYDLYKTAPVSYTPINLDITHTMTMETPPLDEAGYTLANCYIEMGNMMVIDGGGDTFNLTWDITVTLTGNVPFLFAVIGLQRFNLTPLDQPAATYPSFQGPPWAGVGGPGWFLQYNKSIGCTVTTNKLFQPCQSPAYPTSIIIVVYNVSVATATLTWHEDGGSIALPANATWELAGRVGIAPGYSIYNDTNPLDDWIDSGYNCTAWTNTGEVEVWEVNPLDPGNTIDYYLASTTCDLYKIGVGDINHDATVDILDAIILAGHFFSNFGEPNYLPAADLNSDGTIDLTDAIWLASNFGTWYAPPPP